MLAASQPAPEVVLAYIRVLIWPAIAAYTLFLFRAQFESLIERITEVSAAGASVKFSEKVAKLADIADQLVNEDAGRLQEKASTSSGPEVEEPIFVFLDAYRVLESAARDAGPTARVVAPLPVPVIRALARSDLIPKDAVTVAEELRRIRNEVAHGTRRLEAADAASLAATARSLAAIVIGAIEARPPAH